jgi:hypothetical protein
LSYAGIDAVFLNSILSNSATNTLRCQEKR